MVGLPLAIVTYWREQRKERENEDEETYQLLSMAYADFLKLVMGIQICNSAPGVPRRNSPMNNGNGGRWCSKCWCRSSNAPICSA